MSTFRKKIVSWSAAESLWAYIPSTIYVICGIATGIVMHVLLVTDKVTEASSLSYSAVWAARIIVPLICFGGAVVWLALSLSVKGDKVSGNLERSAFAVAVSVLLVFIVSFTFITLDKYEDVQCDLEIERYDEFRADYTSMMKEIPALMEGTASEDEIQSAIIKAAGLNAKLDEYQRALLNANMDERKSNRFTDYLAAHSEFMAFDIFDVTALHSLLPKATNS